MRSILIAVVTAGALIVTPAFARGLGIPVDSAGHARPHSDDAGRASTAVAATRAGGLPDRLAAAMHRRDGALPGMQTRHTWPGQWPATPQPIESARIEASTPDDALPWELIAVGLAAIGLALAATSIVFNRRGGPQRPPVAG